MRKGHHDQAATKLLDIGAALQREGETRERIAHQASLLTHWDTNKDGKWDEDERKRYQTALDRVQRLAHHRAIEKRWYLSYQHQVFGPVRLSELSSVQPDTPLLVCFDGNSSWVCLSDLPSLAAESTTPSAQPHNDGQAQSPTEGLNR